MPFKRFYRKRRMYRKKRRKRYSKKKKLSRNRMSTFILKGISTFPDSLITKLKYVDTMDLTTTLTNRAYAINGLFDPDISGAGHQPLAFDQLMTLYSEYEVFASKVFLYATNNNTIEYILNIYPSITLSFPTAISTSQEQNYSKSIIISDAGAANKNFLSNYIAIRKLEGRRTYSINYVGNASANPSNTRYWLIQAGSLDGTSGMNAQVRIKIVYYAKFFRRISLGPS